MNVTKILKSNYTFVILLIIGTWMSISIYNYELARYAAMGIARIYPGSEPVFIGLPFLVRWLANAWENEKNWRRI